MSLLTAWNSEVPGWLPRESAARMPMCSAADCTNSRPLRRGGRQRPVFEEGCGCSSACMGSMVRRSVRRESQDAWPELAEEPHRHRLPLGLMLLQQGSISHEELQRALASQRTTGERIGEVLVRECGLSDAQITRAVASQWNCPVLTLDHFSGAALSMVMPKRLMVECGVVPMRVVGSSLLYLGFEAEQRVAVALALERMCGLRVEAGLLSRRQFETAQATVLASQGVRCTLEEVKSNDALAERVVKLLEAAKPVASRLVRMRGTYWLRMWLERGALNGAGTIPVTPEDVEDVLFVSAAR